MDDTQASNSVAMHTEGYALVTLVGKQDYMTMDKLAKQCIKLGDQLKVEGKPLLGLVDFSRDPNFTPGTNKAVMQALEEIPYDRIAMFGENKLLGEVTRAVISALGKSDRTKVFRTREEAVAWLLMKDPLRGYGN